MKEKDYETCDLMHGNICVSTPCVCKRFKKPKKEDKAMTKYFKRGTREYYQVTPDQILRIVNKLSVSYVTIIKTGNSLVRDDALEGMEISRDEFKEQFLVASRLIVLEP